MNRACHRQTVVFEVPVAVMTAFVPTPSALSSTIRARQTCFCGELRSATRTSSRRRSALLSEIDIPVRMPQARMPGNLWESNKGFLRLGYSTSGGTMAPGRTPILVVAM